MEMECPNKLNTSVLNNAFNNLNSVIQKMTCQERTKKNTSISAE
jgi:hypothetical protein